MDRDAEDQSLPEDTMLPEYDFSGKQGLRGKYYQAYQQGRATRMVDPEDSDGNLVAGKLNAQIAELVSRLPEIHLIYLFGSQASGEAGPGSDIDLGVLIDRGADERAIQSRLAHEVTLLLGVERVDIVLLQRASISLAYTIIAQGKLIYQRDLATRVEYEAQTLGRYGDYLPVLRAQREQILQGDEHGRRVQRYRAAFRRTERALGEIAAASRKTAR
jgi:predicted nucleotidyltransferase